MRRPDFPTHFRRASVAAALLLAACGGCGSGGTHDAPPFWTSAGVVAADFDGDGRVDVAVAAAHVAGPPPHPGYVRIFRQSAPGAFDAPVQHSVGPDPWGLSAGDFDGDGRLDLVSATQATVAPEPGVIGDSGGISILRQDPARAGSFLASQRVPTGGSATDAAIARLTGDTLADVVVADGVGVNGRALLLAQSPSPPGTLLAPVSLPAGSGRGSDDLAVADVDGDGLSDILLAAHEAVAVFRQHAGGGFDPVVILPAGLRVSGVAVADLNGDDVPDLAVVSLVYQSHSTPSRVSVVLQSPANRGQFAVGAVHDGPYLGNFIATGDVNGDGLDDIVLNDGPSVLLQRAAAPGTFEPVRPLR